MRIPQEYMSGGDVVPYHLLTYPGRVSGQVGVVLGPTFPKGDDQRQWHMTVLVENYDEARNVTQLGVMYGLPETFERDLQTSQEAVGMAAGPDWKGAQLLADAIAKAALGGDDS